ncbi:MAG: 2-amino-4-hydroxy-6-hydroxymethyldihydropteridine diphosphokinase, partial [Amphiplicatus sp.]
ILKDMILIALGSSLSFAGQPPARLIIGALGALGRVAAVTASSRLYASPAWPVPSDPAFVNAVAAISTGLEPVALLETMQAIEAGFGRLRKSEANGPRTLDLDIIDYKGIIRKPDVMSPLELPHPRAHERDFVLAPLAEVAPGWTHPVSGKPVEVLLAECAIRGASALE